MVMKLVVFGATGGTGRCVVEQALASGHDVTAVARDPEGLPLRHERLRVVRADVFQSSEIGPLMIGADAVLSALGPHSYSAKTTVCSRGIQSILGAMRETGVRRLACVSAAPVGSVGKQDTLVYRFLARPLLWTVFKGAYQDMAVMESKVRRSGIDWTIFRPPRLTNGTRTGRYRLGRDQNVVGSSSVSRADLAEAMLSSLEDPAAIRVTFGIGY
jgi:putative NADH-flavin reductase